MKKIKFYPFSGETAIFAVEPQQASKFLPSWYKKTSTMIDNGGMSFGQPGTTVKKCMPIFDLISAGYIVSAPCDIYLDSTNPEKLEWSIPLGLMSFQADMFAIHAKEQYDTMPVNLQIHHKDLLRIFPFWAVGTPKGYSSIFLQPAYSDHSPLTALQAIVDTDTFITDGHLSFWVEKDFKGVIKQGTPLIQVIPFKREAWQKELVPVSESESLFHKQRLLVRSMFMNGYKNLFRQRKTYN
jgi:hypothetical protein